MHWPLFSSLNFSPRAVGMATLEPPLSLPPFLPLSSMCRQAHPRRFLPCLISLSLTCSHHHPQPSPHPSLRRNSRAWDERIDDGAVEDQQRQRGRWRRSPLISTSSLCSCCHHGQPCFLSLAHSQGLVPSWCLLPIRILRRRFPVDLGLNLDEGSSNHGPLIRVGWPVILLAAVPPPQFNAIGQQAQSNVSPLSLIYPSRDWCVTVKAVFTLDELTRKRP